MAFVDQLKDAMNDVGARAGANQWETVAAFVEAYATDGFEWGANSAPCEELGLNSWRLR